MTDKNLTEIICIVDRSGSMASIVNDAIGGFNQFLADQKKLPGNATMTYCQFDNEYEIVHNGKPLNEIPALTHATYQPRGSTALFDAIGKTLNDVGLRLDKTSEDKRPGKVIVVILTDGEENASHEFTREMIKTMIERQRSAYSWEFLFLAANQDAFANANAIGVIHAANFVADHNGTSRAYANFSCSVAQYRSTGDVGSGWTQGDNNLNKVISATSSQVKQ